MRRSRTIRFAVGAWDGLRGQEWIVAARDDDVYVMSAAAQGLRKVSLHGTKWAEAFNQEYKKPPWLNVADRGSMSWLKPDEIARGVTLAFRIIVPTSQLDRYEAAKQSEETIWIPPPLEGSWTEFQIWLVRDGTVDDDDWPARRAAQGPTALVGTRPLSDDRSVFVTYRYDTPESPRNWVNDQVTLTHSAMKAKSHEYEDRLGTELSGIRGVATAQAADGSGVYIDLRYPGKEEPPLPASQNDWLERADLLPRGRLFDLAIAGYDRAAEYGPVPATAQSNRGACFLALDRFDEALKSLEQAAQEQPDLIEPKLNLAVVLLKLDQREVALKHFNAILKRKPDHFESLHNKGNILRQLGRPQEALDAFERALAARANDSDTWRAKAQVLHSLELYEEAETSAREAIRFGRNDPRSHLLLGQLLLNRGRYAEASAVLSDANWLQAGTPGLVAQAKALTAQNQDALALTERILTADPNNIEGRKVRVILLISLDRHDEAILTIDELVADVPEESLLNILKVPALIDLQRQGEALDVAQQLAAVHSGPLVTIALAHATLECGDARAALAVLSHTVDYDDHEAGFQFIRSCALARIGDYQSSCEALASALELGFFSKTPLVDEEHFAVLQNDAQWGAIFLELASRAQRSPEDY